MTVPKSDAAGCAPAEYAAKLAAEVERALQDLEFPDEPRELYEPVRYVLEGGGKRMRPVLTLLAAEAFGGPEAAERGMPAALAVEVFHNFTLVHDDIMDRSGERRGRPTVHLRWDEPTAILCGDLLMGLSYHLLARARADRTAELIHIFHRMVARLCEGQALDMAFERTNDVGVAEYLAMIERKTSALLEAGLEIGALLGGASPTERETIREAGRWLGRAFQIQDDLLDLTAEDARWGKPPGGDLIAGKKTYLLLRALELADGEDRSWFGRILERPGLAPDALGEARGRMDALGVLRMARREVEQDYGRAVMLLERLPEGCAARTMCFVVDGLLKRVR